MHTTRPLVQIFGLTFDLSIILTSTTAALVVLVFAYLCTRQVTTKKPGKMQNLLEWVIEFIQNIMMNSMGRKDNLFILAGGVGLILYLFIANTHWASPSPSSPEKIKPPGGSHPPPMRMSR